MSQQEFEKEYSDYVLALRREVGMSETEFRSLFEADLLRSKVEEAFAEEVATVDEQVQAVHILVETEEEARTALDRLAEGEDFGTLADELSLDTATEGGDLGWFPRGMMVPEFEEVAFSLAVGETSDPVQTSFGHHIIKVLDREAARELDDAVLEQRKAAALSEWLVDARQAEAVERFWSSDKVPDTP
jgi:parvulin-like peptidyl-prolyl isomerase